MVSPLPTIEDVAMSPAGKKFGQAEKTLAIPPLHIASWLRKNSRHSNPEGLFIRREMGVLTLGAGRRVWLLLPPRFSVKPEKINEVVVISHPSMNGMDPHHLYRGMATCIVTNKPVFMIPASVRSNAWRLPRRQSDGDYLLWLGSNLLGFIKESIVLQSRFNLGIKFAEKLRVHLQGWSQGGTLSLAMAGAARVRSDFEVASLIVGGLPNVVDRSRRQLFRDISSIRFMDYVQAGQLSGPTYTSLHCPNGRPDLLETLRMSAKLLGDVCASWRDNLPLHEAFRYATLGDQLGHLSSEMLQRTVIVSAKDDPVSPSPWVHCHAKRVDTRPHVLSVNGTHTFGDVMAWPFFAADQVGLAI